MPFPFRTIAFTNLKFGFKFCNLFLDWIHVLWHADPLQVNDREISNNTAASAK
jgi:hypothetical protein